MPQQSYRCTYMGFYSATDRNEHLISLLKDLAGRVSSEDKGRIESALNDVSSSEAMIRFSIDSLPSSPARNASLALLHTNTF
jgi:hypothetical protein